MGRKAFEPAPDFESAMAALAPAEAQYVRHCLAGDVSAKAFRKVFPDYIESRVTDAAHKMAQRKHVAHALRLGREAGAVQAISGLKYDLTAAHEEICQRIEKASEEGQHSAVAQMLKLKAAIHKLDQPPVAVAGANFTLVIKGPEEKVIEPDSITITKEGDSDDDAGI